MTQTAIETIERAAATADESTSRSGVNAFALNPVTERFVGTQFTKAELERNRRAALISTVVLVVALGLIMLWFVDGYDWFGSLTVLIGVLGLLWSTVESR